MNQHQSATRTNLVLLYARIRELDLDIKEVAIRAGMKPPTLYNKLKGRGHFTDVEIAGLRYALQLSNEDTCQIFICGYEPNHQAV